MGVILFNFGDEDFQVAIGDRIAQFILERIHIPVLIEHAEKLDDTVRGEAGFGSTGVSVWKVALCKFCLFTAWIPNEYFVAFRSMRNFPQIQY